MLKPFYNKKKNIDDRLVPEVSAADAGRVLGVTEEGKIAAVEGGGDSGLPDITVNDIGKTLVVGSDRKLRLISESYKIRFDSEDGTVWTADHTYNQLAGIIINSPVPIKFDFEFWMGDISAGDAYNTIGVLVSRGSTYFVRFVLSSTEYVSISSDDTVEVFFDS